ncbi:MAG: glycosyltransferase family 9 protein [Bacteroidales bacterium]
MVQNKKYKILIIRFSSIGDIVLTTPVIRCLYNQLNCEIHYLTKIQNVNILQPSNYIKKIYSYDGKNLNELIKSLKLERFDFICDLHNNIRSKKVTRRLKTDSKSVNKCNIKKWLYVNSLMKDLSIKHIVDRYLDTTSKFNIKNDGLGLDFFLNKEEKLPVEYDLVLNDKEYIVIAVGAQHFTKQIPNDKLISICNKDKEFERLNNYIKTNFNDNLNSNPLKFVLIGGTQDIDKEKKIVEGVNNKEDVINLTGKLSINGSALIMHNSKLVITGDTGMMHIAAALRKNIVVFWGNTVPEFGMYPYFPTNFNGFWVSAENKKIKCRPCSKIGYEKCKRKHFKCMNENELYRYS